MAFKLNVHKKNFIYPKDCIFKAFYNKQLNFEVRFYSKDYANIAPFVVTISFWKNSKITQYPTRIMNN